MSGNPLVVLRKELVDALNALPDRGAQAYPTVPEEVGPPLVTIGAGRPYLSYEGSSFGTTIVRHQVLAVVENGENESEDELLDALVLDVVNTLAPTRFTVEEVDQPGEYIVNGQAYLGVSLNVWTEADLRTT